MRETDDVIRWFYYKVVFVEEGNIVFFCPNGNTRLDFGSGLFLFIKRPPSINPFNTRPEHLFQEILYGKVWAKHLTKCSLAGDVLRWSAPRKKKPILLCPFHDTRPPRVTENRSPCVWRFQNAGLVKDARTDGRQSSWDNRKVNATKCRSRAVLRVFGIKLGLEKCSVIWSQYIYSLCMVVYCSGTDLSKWLLWLLAGLLVRCQKWPAVRHKAENVNIFHQIKLISFNLTVTLAWQR